MEVHKHAHSPRTRWTHYLWEFVMLFLAVFCGFLAENQREHFVEKERAREYAELMLEDLKNDARYIDSLFTAQSVMMRKADSLLVILSSDQYANNKGRVVMLISQVSVMVDFKPAFPINFEQVKNSGSLRYFKNKELVSSISEFDRMLETIADVYADYNRFIHEYLRSFMIHNLNTLQFDNFTRSVSVPNPDIFNWNKREAVLLANKVNLKKTYDVYFVNRFLKQCAEKNQALITEIKNEYHL